MRSRRPQERHCAGLAVPSLLPEQLQSELDLARRGRRARNRSRGSGKARQICGRGRREDDEVRSVEISAVQEIEDLSPELDAKPLANSCFLQNGKVPCGEPWTCVGVPAGVAKESAVGRRRDKGGWIEPLGGISRHDAPRKVRVEERAYGIPGVSRVRGVVTELRRKGKSGLRGNDARDGPAAHKSVLPSRQIARESSAATKRKFVDHTHGGYMTYVECRETFV